MMETVPSIGSKVRITDEVPNPSWAGAIVEVIERPSNYPANEPWPCYGRLIKQHPDALGGLSGPGQVTCLELWYLEPLKATPEEIESAIAGVEAILADEF